MSLHDRWALPQDIALFLALCGLIIYFWCIWDFAAIGRGTPAPIDPPKILVVHGLYQYVRNPMYIGVLLLLVAESPFFESSSLFKYVVGTFICFHLFIVLYEEANLRRRFGESYIHYCQSVNRWLPGKKYQGPK
jgi:protein-S-isoprenylcysteine O-methyltransferase Ste14